MAERKHNVAREGIVAGVIGATSVALWFFVVDAIAGHPLATPGTLGRALVSVLGMPEASSGMRLLDQPATAVVLYTLFHYAAFIAVGILVTALVHKAETQPHVLAGFLILFVAFELGFYGLTALLSEVGLGGMAWYQIGAANLIASLLMGIYLWRRHPALGRELRFVLNGQE